MLIAWPVLASTAIFFATWMKPALPNGEWFQVYVCVCVCVCVCAWAHLHVRFCVSVCACACVCAHVCVGGM